MAETLICQASRVEAGTCDDFLPTAKYRRDHPGTFSQGQALSAHDERSTRENALSDVMIKRAFHPLRRDAIERASGNYEPISSRGPLAGTLPSGQTETGHRNRPENSAPGHVTSRNLRLRQKRRAEQQFRNGNVSHYRFTRRVESGVTMPVAEVTIREVRSSRVT
ncbi:MAG: hypothetical protein AAYR33_07725 [Acetobacteraceae bacterium]